MAVALAMGDESSKSIIANLLDACDRAEFSVKLQLVGSLLETGDQRTAHNLCK
ncbi:MAG: hypothetical protein ACI841_000833 [Planctomycetota bacterium]|jgi:hypothetical protein